MSSLVLPHHQAVLADRVALSDTEVSESADLAWSQRPASSLQYVTQDRNDPLKLTTHTVTSKSELLSVMSKHGSSGFWDSKVRSLSNFEPSQWNIDMISSLPVSSSVSLSGVRVAVLDTGVSQHPDLKSLLPGFDLVDKDSDPTDLSGHGTHVAGIVAAARDDSGVAGVAPSVAVLPIRVLDANGSGLVSDIVSGISIALDNNAKVLNLSLGSSSDIPALKNAVTVARSRGALVVAAAGNSGTSGAVSYPAAYPEVLAVASVTKLGAVSSFSSRGSYVDLSAPGSSILSTHKDGTHRIMSGTSMAAPHVAAAAALLFAAHPQATPDQVSQALCESSTDIDSPGIDESTGCGVISVSRALERLSLSVATTTTTPSSSVTQPTTTTTTTPAPSSTQPVLTTQPVTTTAPTTPPTTTPPLLPPTQTLPQIPTQDSPGQVLLSREGPDVVLLWDPPSVVSPDGYYVLREGSLPVPAVCCSFRDQEAASEFGVLIYKVFAFSASGISSPQTASVAFSPPVRPSLKAQAAGRKRVKLSLSALVPGAVVKIYRDGSLIYTGITTTRTRRFYLYDQPSGNHTYSARQELDLGTSKASKSSRIRVR